MTISIVAQVPPWKETAEKYREHAQIADTNLRNQIAASSARLATANDAIRRNVAEIGNVGLKLKEASSKVGQLQSDIARAESEKSSAEAINRGLIAQLQSSESTRQEYRKQRDGLEIKNIDLSKRNTELNDRTNELTAQIAVMAEQKRHFEQQINILRAENDKLASTGRGGSSGNAFEDPTGAAMGHVVASSPVAKIAIRGEVIDVSGDIITLSIGAADNVKEGMVFVVHRDDQYIGDIRISLVSPKQAAGRPVGNDFQAEPGDSVTDALTLSSSRG